MKIEEIIRENEKERGVYIRFDFSEYELTGIEVEEEVNLIISRRVRECNRINYNIRQVDEKVKEYEREGVEVRDKEIVVKVRESGRWNKYRVKDIEDREDRIIIRISQ